MFSFISDSPLFFQYLIIAAVLILLAFQYRAVKQGRLVKYQLSKKQRFFWALTISIFIMLLPVEQPSWLSYAISLFAFVYLYFFKEYYRAADTKEQ